MRKIIASIFLCFLGLALQANEKYALIVAIGDYPAKTGWGNISSANDVPLIEQALISQAFKKDHISVLLNENATKAGILKALKTLYQKVNPGDIVVLHVSAHGQQILDENGDELDGLDEAIIPYDAWSRYTYNYKGENHLKDDEIGVIIANFREKLGQEGQILMLLDSCHSGTASRGGKARGSMAPFVPIGWKAPEVKTMAGSDMFEKVKLTNNAASFVLISGASANELNYEYNGVGSLSYAFSKAINNLGSKFTYRQLFAKIEAIMNVICPNQRPTIEGNLDFIFLNGEYVLQQPYFAVSEFINNDQVKIQSGMLNGLHIGTTVNLLPSGSTNVEENKIMAKGTIAKVKYNEGIIKLDRPLKKKNPKDYWIFVDQRSYGNLSIRVFFDKSMDKVSHKKNIIKFFKETKFGEVVTDENNADIIVQKDDANTLQIVIAKHKMVLDSFPLVDDTESFKDIKSTLFNFAQGQYLKALSLKNNAHEFEFKLVPHEYDTVNQVIGKVKPDSSHVNAAGTFFVRPEIDAVKLQVTNKSNTPFYINIVEINSKGVINSFLPNPDCDLSDEERLIPPQTTVTIQYGCYYVFYEPYERLMLKAFATPSPLNLSPTIKSRGQEKAEENNNPLALFIAKTYLKKRGSSGQNSNGAIDGYSAELIYEIVKE